MPGTTFVLADDVHTFYYDIPQPMCVLRKTSTNLECEVDSAFQSVLSLLDGRHTLNDIAIAFSATSYGSGELQVFMKDTMNEVIQDLLRELIRQGFLHQARLENLTPLQNVRDNQESSTFKSTRFSEIYDGKLPKPVERFKIIGEHPGAIVKIHQNCPFVNNS